jgi:hypothetical protein
MSDETPCAEVAGIESDGRGRWRAFYANAIFERRGDWHPSDAAAIRDRAVLQRHGRRLWREAQPRPGRNHP